jgi:putative DNA methylase
VFLVIRKDPGRAKATVRDRLAPFYVSKDEAGAESRLLHAFWVQTVECAECACRFDAHPTFRFAWDEKTDRQWVACRDCSRVLEGKLSAESFKCPCGKRTEPSSGHWDHGAAVCPKCRRSERLIDNAKRLGPPRFRMFAVETIPSGAERRYPNSERRILGASAHDLDVFVRAESEFQRLTDGDALEMPNAEIPREGRSDDRLLRYGYASYGDLFNTRQKLHLALLADEISKIGNPAVREAMAIAFSDHLKTNNMMCGYAGGWRRLSPLFAIRAYRHIARPVEINPWLEHNGRGTFPNAVRATINAAKSLKSSVEPTLAGLVQKVPPHRPKTWDVRVGDARNLDHIPDASVDLVLTDPPYFDYIAYSELGHFFVPWLVKFGLVDASHLGKFPEGQLASSGRAAVDAIEFGEKLSEVMREIARVTKTVGRIVFTYQDLDGRGWAALAAAMAHAAILPITAFPMFGDGASGLHKHENSISWDCVLVCRTGPPVGAFEVRHPETPTAPSPTAGDASLGTMGTLFRPGTSPMRHVGRLLASFEKKAWEDDGRGAVASYTKGAARPIHG